MKLFVIAALAAFGISTAYANEPVASFTPPKAEKIEEKKKPEMKLAKKKADVDKEKAAKKAEKDKK
jgi:hypothetical protein